MTSFFAKMCIRDRDNTDDIAKNLTLKETIEAAEQLEESTDYSIEFTGDRCV